MSTSSWVAKRFILALSQDVRQLFHLLVTWTSETSEDFRYRSAPLLCAAGTQSEPPLCNGEVDLNKLTPPGTALRTVTEILRWYQSAEPVTILGPRVEGYKFVKSRGAVVALWSLKGTTTVDLTRLGVIASVRDQDGGVSSASPNAFLLDKKVTYVTLR